MPIHGALLCFWPVASSNRSLKGVVTSVIVRFAAALLSDSRRSSCSLVLLHMLPSHLLNRNVAGSRLHAPFCQNHTNRSIPAGSGFFFVSHFSRPCISPTVRRLRFLARPRRCYSLQRFYASTLDLRLCCLQVAEFDGSNFSFPVTDTTPAFV